jgi:hypothetical protein
MTLNPRRWWLVRALGRNHMVRAVDRVEALAVLAGVLLVAMVGLQCSSISDSVYASRSRTIAAEAATRHQVEATVVTDSTADAKTTQQSAQRYSTQIRWFAQNTSRDKVVKLAQPVKAGDHVPVWLDEHGNASTPPRTDADARADAVGAVALLLALAAGLAFGAVALLRWLLDRLRYRSWDRGLHWLLVENGGGPTTRTPDDGA